MAMKASMIGLLMLLVVHCGGARAQSGCTMAIVSLSPCMNYVSGNSSTPSSSCCSQLSSVVTSQPQCLCTLLKGGASNFGIVMNQTLALALPGACKVQTPPLTQCDAPSGAPAPANSPSETPDFNTPDVVPTTPSETDVPSGSKAVPGRDGPSVGGSNGPARLSLMGVVFLIASSWVFTS